MTELTHGSLFSGIGGFDLAAEWAGWNNAFHCEMNPFGRKVLNYYWPNAKSYHDITKTDFTIWRGRIGILTGGFPCQPYSTAGKRKGKEDERHLWPEMLRAIQEIEPRWIVGENVSGIVNWNGGLVFEEVQTDLEAEGYEVLPILLPACGVNAPHKRERIWFIAQNTMFSGCIHRESKQERAEIREQRNISARGSNWVYLRKRHISNTSKFGCYNRSNNRKKRHIQNNFNRITKEDKSKRNRRIGRFGKNGKVRNASNSNSKLLKRWSDKKRPNKTKRHFSESFRGNTWENFPTQSPVCVGNDGISARLDVKTVLKAVGRKVNKRFKAFNWWRKESIMAGGNAIVPQVVYEIFKVINKMEEQWKN